MTTHRLGSAFLAPLYWRMLSPEAVQVCPNSTWPTSMEMLGFLAQQLGDAGGAGIEMAVAADAVAVELDVRQVQRQALGGADGRQRRLHVAGNAEVAAVHVQRMRHAELQEPARQRQQDVAGRDAVVGVLLVEIEFALVELEGADAAGVDDLDRDRLGGVHGPGDVVLDLREIVLARRSGAA